MIHWSGGIDLMADKEMQFLLYQAEAEQVSVNALIREDNIWLTQKSLWAFCLGVLLTTYLSI